MIRSRPRLRSGRAATAFGYLATTRAVASESWLPRMNVRHRERADLVARLFSGAVP
jgi:hypothetical protein